MACDGAKAGTMTFNDFAAWLLRSPFYWMMGRGTMLVTVIGRKSGKPITLPVNYFQDEDILWVTSRRNRVWWRNLKDKPEMVLSLHGKEMKARGELLLDEGAVADQLTRIYSGKPVLARALHIRSVENGKLNPDDVRRVAADRLLVKIRIS
jgi:hypothetical protein